MSVISMPNNISFPQYHLESNYDHDADTQYNRVWQEKRESYLQLWWMGTSDVNPVKMSAPLISLNVLKIFFLMCISMMPTGLSEDMQ